MSNRVCIYPEDDTYYDWAEFWPVSDGTIKCCECHEPIPFGDVYQEHRCFTDDLDADDCSENPAFDTYRTCRICAKIRDDYMKCGFYYENLWEDLDDHLEDDEDCWDWSLK